MSAAPIDWAALKVGDPDPEPQADGMSCAVYVRHPASGVTFDCTRSPHSDPRHVSCAHWGAMTAADAIVVAMWDDDEFDHFALVETLTPDAFEAIDRRFGHV